MRHILKCSSCMAYSLMDVCPACGSESLRVGPAKFSPQDAYASYRRAAKADALRRAGLL